MKSKSWSYSQLGAYKQCPHKWMYQRIIKLPEPPSYHLTRGNAIHATAEEYLLGKLDKLPVVLNKFAIEFSNLRKAGAIPEQAMVLNKDWQLVGNIDAWSHDDAWLRLKIDARLDNLVIDFKTGKQYAEHAAQGELYATAIMATEPLDEIDVKFWYLDSGNVSDTLQFTRKDLVGNIEKYNEEVAIMHNDTTFEPKVNQWCKYCYVKNLCTAYK